MERKSDAPPVAGEWRDHAEFTLFFDYVASEELWQGQNIETGRPRRWRTRVYHQESDKEDVFVGTDPTQWMNWILRNAGLTEFADWSSTTETKSVGAQPSSTTATGQSQAVLYIDNLQVASKDTHSPGKTRRGNIAIEVRFNIKEIRTNAIPAQGVPYQVELHAVNLDNGATKLVALSRSEIQIGVYEYVYRHALPALAVGRYSLEAIVFLMPPVQTIAFCPGPTITIIP